MTLVERLLRRAALRQKLFFEKLSPEAKKKLAEAEGKYAELLVTGPEGGKFYLQFVGGQLLLLDGKPNAKEDELDHFLIRGDYVNYPSGDEVLFAILDGELSAAKARANRLVLIKTNRTLYDSEELRQAFEKFLDEIRKLVKTGKVIDE